MDLKQKLSLLSLATLLGCSTTYAKRDYDQYPEHKDEIALYNLKEIANDRCSLDSKFINTLPRCESMKFDERWFEYNYKECTSYTLIPVPSYSPGQQGRMARKCTDAHTTTYTFYWKDITKIIPGEGIVKICIKDKENCTDIGIFKDERQADDFAEALNIYRKSKK